jgi:hypothetical protein
MRSPTSGWLRALRAASLGLAGFVLALVAHAAAGGATPGAVVLLWLACLTGLAAALLTRVRMSPVRIVLSLTTMQVVLHEAFMRLGSPVDCSTAVLSMPGDMPAGHGSQPALECSSGMAETMAQTWMGQGSVSGAAAMVGAHAAATAVMAALLAYGETVLWFLAQWVRPARWMRPGLPELPRVPAVTVRAPQMLRVWFNHGGVGRRGPPTRELFAIV